MWPFRVRRHSRSSLASPVTSLAALSLALAALISSDVEAASVSLSSPLDCSKPITLPSGNRYDLSSLAKRGPVTVSASYDTPPTTTTYTLDVSLCSALDPNSSPAEERCPPNTRICQRVRSKPKSGSGEGMVTHVIPLVTESYGYQILQDSDGAGAASSFQLHLHGPEYAARPQKVKLEMVCDKSASNTVPEFKEYELMDGKAELKWRTPAACPLDNSGVGSGSGDNGGGSSPARTGGWGFFSWLFFLGSLALIAYFAIGTYLNQQRYGVMEIPHRDFWRESPYLVMDVGRHAWKSVSGSGGGGSGRPGGYEAL
ncbi:unnamed protein product [Parajaminaea phylloscopi]